MEDRFYRCGWCGIPTDKDGNPEDLTSVAIKILIERNQLQEELVHGYCCAEEQHHQHSQQTITHDMAIDAGDMSLEGQPY